MVYATQARPLVESIHQVGQPMDGPWYHLVPVQHDAKRRGDAGRARIENGEIRENLGFHRTEWAGPNGFS